MKIVILYFLLYLCGCAHIDLSEDLSNFYQLDNYNSKSIMDGHIYVYKYKTGTDVNRIQSHAKVIKSTLGLMFGERLDIIYYQDYTYYNINISEKLSYQDALLDIQKNYKKSPFSFHFKLNHNEEYEFFNCSHDKSEYIYDQNKCYICEIICDF